MPTGWQKKHQPVLVGGLDLENVGGVSHQAQPGHHIDDLDVDLGLIDVGHVVICVHQPHRHPRLSPELAHQVQVAFVGKFEGQLLEEFEPGIFPHHVEIPRLEGLALEDAVAAGMLEGEVDDDGRVVKPPGAFFLRIREPEVVGTERGEICCVHELGLVVAGCL